MMGSLISPWEPRLGDNGTTITNPANTGGVYIYYSVNRKANDSGVADVFLSPGTDAGADTLLELTHDFTTDEPAGTNNVYFGSAVAKALYTNEDFADLFIGAERYDALGTDAGLVYIYEGTAMGFAPTPSPISGLDNPAIDAAEQLGSAIMVLDINGDGNEDLVIGASADDTPGINAGSVYFKLYQYNLAIRAAGGGNLSARCVLL